MTASGDGDGSVAHRILITVQEEEVELDIREEETAGQVVTRLLTRCISGDAGEAGDWALWAIPSRKGRGWWTEEEIVDFAPGESAALLAHAKPSLIQRHPSSLTSPSAYFPLKPS